jgi:hypothetical protein
MASLGDVLVSYHSRLMKILAAIQIHQPHRPTPDAAGIQSKKLWPAVSSLQCRPVAKDYFVGGGFTILVRKPGLKGQWHLYLIFRL